MDVVLTESQKQFGKNVLLGLVDLNFDSIPNYHQCYLTQNTIIVITKNGGKKRICHNFYKNIEMRLDELKVCGTCDGCFQTIILPKNKNYIVSKDCFDNPVYAITEFRVPQEKLSGIQVPDT